MSDAALSQPPAAPSLARRIAFAIPVLGWMLRDIERGGEEEMLFFAGGVAASLGCATLAFGLPGLVIGMLCMAALVGTAVVFVTFG